MYSDLPMFKNITSMAACIKVPCTAKIETVLTYYYRQEKIYNYYFTSKIRPAVHIKKSWPAAVTATVKDQGQIGRAMRVNILAPVTGFSYFTSYTMQHYKMDCVCIVFACVWPYVIPRQYAE